MPEGVQRRKQGPLQHDLGAIPVKVLDEKPDKTKVMLSSTPRKESELVEEYRHLIVDKISNDVLNHAYTKFLQNLSVQQSGDFRYYEAFLDALKSMGGLYYKAIPKTQEAFGKLIVYSGMSLSLGELQSFSSAVWELGHSAPQEAAAHLLSSMLGYRLSRDYQLKEFTRLLANSKSEFPYQEAYVWALDGCTNPWRPSKYDVVDRVFSQLRKHENGGEELNFTDSHFLAGMMKESAHSSLFFRMFEGKASNLKLREMLSHIKLAAKGLIKIEKPKPNETISRIGEEDIARLRRAGAMFARALDVSQAYDTAGISKKLSVDDRFNEAFHKYFSGLFEDAKSVDFGDMAAFFASYATQAVQSAPKKARFSKAQEMVRAFQKLGLEFYERYEPDVLDSIYRTVSDPDFSRNKKLAIVVLNKNDWNGAFEDNSRLCRELIGNGYALLICEASTEYEAVSRFFNYGLENEAKTAVSGKLYDFLMLGGHGTPWEINFGKIANKAYFEGDLPDEIMRIVEEVTDLDLSDFKEFGLKQFSPGGWADRFSDSSIIVLQSCSTGGTMGKEVVVENPGNFQNIMEMVGVLANRPGDTKVTVVLAPTMPSNIQRFVFDKGRVVGVQYFEGLTSVYSPKDK